MGTLSKVNVLKLMEGKAKMNTIILKNLDGSIFKTVEVKDNWYVPPIVAVYGYYYDYFIRTSADSIHDPVEFVRATAILIPDKA
jgi:hypothetical protein